MELFLTCKGVVYRCSPETLTSLSGSESKSVFVAMLEAQICCLGMTSGRYRWRPRFRYRPEWRLDKRFSCIDLDLDLDFDLDVDLDLDNSL